MPCMTQTSLPQPHEQRKVEVLLMKLAKIKPVSAKPAPITNGRSAILQTNTAHSRVFYST